MKICTHIHLRKFLIDNVAGVFLCWVYITYIHNIHVENILLYLEKNYLRLGVLNQKKNDLKRFKKLICVKVIRTKKLSL